MSKTKVLIVEDQAMPRKMFEMTVKASDDFELAASIDNADLADIYCLNRGVDLIIMDVLTKDGASGLEASKKIKFKFPNIKIIVVTSMPEYSFIDYAKKIGVDSFCYKESMFDNILSVMKRTMDGEKVYPDEVPVISLGAALSTDFTRRELEVLKLMTGGYTNTEIGEKLFISLGTVKTHIQSMLDKTSFRNRTELAVKARESGIVILGYTEE
ncbi:MAG: response regulator transcription factor [Clostridia bacterium]|nr:response regulator transcription factor [Clostridia bacterium]